MNAFTPAYAQPADTGTVARVALLLRLIAEHEGAFGLGELARRANLPAPTVHRLLDLLAQQGIVEHEKLERSYRIGAEFYRIAALVRANVPVDQLVRPVLADAAKEVDESCYFALYLPAQQAVMYDCRVDSSHPLDYRIALNRPMSLLWGASGRTVLAHLPGEDIEAIHRKEKDGGLEVPVWRDLAVDLAKIRECGYGYTRGHRIRGATGILAPVFNEYGRIYGCLGYTVPDIRMREDMVGALADAAMRHAARLSTALGHRP